MRPNRPSINRTGPIAPALTMLSLLIVLATPPAARAALQVERVDGETSSVTGLASLVLDGGGNPHVSYAAGDSLGYARKTAGAWAIDKLGVPFFSLGQHSSLVLDGAGNPHISYQIYNTENVVYSWKSGGGWHTETPTYTPQSGLWNSLALDPQGYPVITHVMGGLSYAIRYDRRSAGGWTGEFIEAELGIGFSGSSLVVDGSGVSHVTYNGAGGFPRYARKAGSVWTIETIEAVGCGVAIPIQLDAQGVPHVVYATSAGVRYARRAGGAWSIETANDDPVGGFNPMSLALDVDGEPHVAYSRFFECGLIYARRAGGTWHRDVAVDTTFCVGWANAIAVDAAGEPRFVLADGTNYDLLYGRYPSVTGVVGPDRRSTDLVIFPNPSRGGPATIVVRRAGGHGPERSGTTGTPPGRLAEAAIHDLTGRLVRRLGPEAAGGDGASFVWNGLDDGGGRAAAGLYVVRVLDGRGPALTGRLTIVR